MKYDIILHYSEPPQVRYYHPSFGDIKWTEEATELVIMAGALAYSEEEVYLDAVLHKAK